MRLAMAAFAAALLTACGGATNEVNKGNEESKSDSSVLFRSGFEDGVFLADPFHDEGGTWWQPIEGEDASGYAWPMNIWGSDGALQVLVDSSLPVGDYLSNELEETIGHDGTTTRALHLRQFQKAEDWTQDPYLIETKTEDSDLYVSYWMRFPDDLPSALGPDGWFAFLEWKTCCNGYRIAVYVYSDPDQNLYWYAHGDNETDDAPVYEEYWQEENRDLAVPIGEWFQVEVFLHRSDGDDGRFWWRVNGETVADRMGPNRGAEDFDRWMPFTLYSNAEAVDLWIDDIEVRDSLP